MMAEMQQSKYLPGWLSKVLETTKESVREPRSWLEYLTWAGAALFGAGLTAGLTGYGVIRLYYDWMIDDYLVAQSFQKYLKATARGAPFNVINLLEKHAANQPDKVYVVFEKQKFTFRETDLVSNFHANALLSLGVGGVNGGDMAMLMTNCPEFLFTLYACLKVNVKVALLNTSLRAKSLVHCIKEAGSKVLLVDNDSDLIDAVREVYEELKQQGIRVVLYGKSTEFESFTTVLEYSSDKPINKEFRNVDDNPSATALYVYTSGTTGLPKAVRISHGRLSFLPFLMFIYGVTPNDVVYCPLPLFHASGLVGSFSCLAIGCTFAIARKFSVRNFWSDCEMHEATVIQYIGETCRYLMSPLPGSQDKKHKVRLAIGNGLRTDIWKEYQCRFNIKQIGEFYGGSDLNCFLVNVRSRFGAVGVHSPARDRDPANGKLLYLKYDVENDCIVRDPVTGLCRPRPLGTAGLLVGEITPRSSFDGYNDPKQTEKKIIHDVLEKGDSYLNSGDILCRNKDYTVHFVDRIGDTFRWKGENVSTLEVGNIITEVEPISDCCAYGVQIPNTDGRACMVALVPEQRTSASHQEILEALQKHCEHALPSYARPIFVRFLEEMVLSETFKHQKYKMQTDGYNETKVKDLYVMDQSAKRYVQMTANIQNEIRQGTFKL